MEGGGDLDVHVKTPLLVTNGAGNGCHLRNGNVGIVVRMNSVTTLRCDFLSNLPDKVRAGLDPETPFDLDISKTAGLIEGEKQYYEKQFATLKSFEEVDLLESHAIDEEQELQEQGEQ